MISVVIPTYKNKEETIINLKHNLPFFKGCEIVVINDNPQERLRPDFDLFPQIKLIENDINLGFAGAVHKAIQQTKGDFILLLNNDVLLNDNSFLNATNMLQKDENLFAVSFAQKEKDSTIVGKNILYWEKGFFQHKKAYDVKTGINGWAEGGSCIVNKKLYEKIGGFDPLYSPFYWEDIDLSYRAWKAGYKIIFDPRIQVIHHHESTIGKLFEKNQIQIIAYRNQFIFIWKNIQDTSLLINHFAYLPFFLISQIIKGHFSIVQGLISALFLLPSIIKKRHIIFKNNTFSDISILNKFRE